ncbi:dienelactone hydrolase [Coprinopsis cinerea okayama7|uniref:Dienelactone hydrolase n=1 Tax=Coprinopsis cinerea (strain Okayama-7 / 130 / ATCC MYA-4618 / FGSC 9003) TaxID=240176 RepID=A8N2H9_COPC7|nr:dienelactone hydrolase [Coprinopsis cinerea okayama7\|eukprot:XP_001828999.2 dienelactone hydrolase [Coprinopsis cinerea okayama7\
MSTTVNNPNKACCTIPPVQSDYKPKGTYKSLGDYKRVYTTGPEKSENAIVCVFDIFGFFPQTLQGADIIADSLKTTVYMPDFFEPEEAFSIEKFPPRHDQDKQDLQDFFGGIASPPATTKKLTTFGAYLKSQGHKKVATYGFCWGGKVVVCGSGENTPFDASAIVHPAMMSVEDVKNLTIPFAVYPSQDEPESDYNEIVDVISKKRFANLCDHKYYKDMFHGWAAARGDLTKEDNKQAYEDVYGRLIAFFNKAL